MKDEIVSLEEAYEIAAQLCPSIMKKLEIPSNKISEEDVIGQFITNFIEKGFLNKFNPRVTSFRYYVYMGVRNAAVSMIRHLKYEVTSLDAITRPDPDGKVLDIPAPEPVQEMIMKGLLEEVWDFSFGYGKIAKLYGAEEDLIAELPSTARSVLQMLFMKYSKDEVAAFFGVTVSTINNVISSVRDQVKARKITPQDCLLSAF